MIDNALDISPRLPIPIANTRSMRIFRHIIHS